jgi:hypothetical protein
LALDAGDLQPDVPARLIYDGERFQLVSAIQLPCKAGFSAVNKAYCIADSAAEAATFFAATNLCATQGGRLCTFSEWAYACRSMTGFLATVGSAEWVDHAANYTNGAKLVGAGIDGEVAQPGVGCTYGGLDLPTNPYRYRCCTTR